MRAVAAKYGVKNDKAPGFGVLVKPCVCPKGVSPVIHTILGIMDDQPPNFYGTNHMFAQLEVLRFIMALKGMVFSRGGPTFCNESLASWHPL